MSTLAHPHDHLTNQSVGEVLARGPVAITANASIREAALVMRNAGVSSLLVTAEPDARGALLGFLTDRDLRNRVVADGLDIDSMALSVASHHVHTITASAPVFEAMLMMTRLGIHHLPVVEGGHVIGVLSGTRLQELHTSSPLALAARIHRQGDVAGLAALAGEVGGLQRELAAAEASAYNSGRILTSITDALTVRLIELAQERLGPPPVDYAWVAAGSQARTEQTAKSDQDNCLVLDDDYDEAEHGAYFRALSHYVCDGLDVCGYVHCPGEMMAMTDQWRQPRHTWLRYFRKWVHQPDPQALMLTCVFFDQRVVHGNAELLRGLRQQVLQDTAGNAIFLAHMASNALSRTPPLGLFGQLNSRRDPEHPGTLNMKHHGLVPIVDLARVYALAGGIAAVNTQDRLHAVGNHGEVSQGSARDLSDALEFMAFLRLRHQARQMAAGQQADNFMRPDSLSNFERTQLKEAFNVVQTLQEVLTQRYGAGRF
jgi:CBS domain-containing protein